MRSFISKVRPTVHTNRSQIGAIYAKGQFGDLSAGVRVHKGITVVLSLFRSHWLAVECIVWSFVAALVNR